MTKGESTKQHILSVSLDLFSKNGFAGTSIRQIAKAVGIRESGIYNHFSSKGQIFREISETLKARRLAITSLMIHLSKNSRIRLSF